MTRNMSFSISRLLPAAFLLPPSRWGCGVLVALAADTFDGAVERGPRVITVGVTIDVEVMRMITGVLTTGTVTGDTTTDVVVSGVILAEVVVLLDGELLGAAELEGIVDVVGLGVVPERILKSALYTIDSIGTRETK